MWEKLSWFTTKFSQLTAIGKETNCLEHGIEKKKKLVYMTKWHCFAAGLKIILLLYQAKLFSRCHVKSWNVSSSVVLKHGWADHEVNCFVFFQIVLWLPKMSLLDPKNVIAKCKYRYLVQFKCLILVTCFTRLEVLAHVIRWTAAFATIQNNWVTVLINY